MTLFDSGNLEPRELLPGDGSMAYHRGFYSSIDSDALMAELLREVPWEARPITVFGRTVLQPRLACWYGDVSYSYSGITLEPRSWSTRLAEVKAKVEEFTGHRFNSVLANLYRNGNDSMGWHADDEPELGVEPLIASVSLGQRRTFRIRHRETKETVSIDLESGSLVVMSGLSQKCWVHEVPKARRITEPRINLTFRYVFQAP
ncbi:MAG: hypothetical protein RL119_1503 [Actinomycetota bacterium]|jgi:alkylated DNA repair dioxygenase AlkB